jgi:D-glycero-alpha-D-manno-heptose-7-phosphate kinase
MEKNMIISKTPLRMSYVGGGSDMPDFYREHGGAVISTALDIFVHVIVKKRFEPGIRVSYSKTENVLSVDEVEHPIVRNALNSINFDDDIEIVSIADVPSSGTGLGSSSSFSVGLVNCLSAYRGINLDADALAKAACHLEIDLCGSPIGKQDQYAAAFGGIKVYKFNQDDTVEVNNVLITPETKKKLDDETMTFYIGGARSANKILEHQKRELKSTKKVELMNRMVNLVWNLKQELEGQSLLNFGAILHENWELKRSISEGIANSYIDELYKTALSCGATGGKLLGAGGGGFMIFHAPTETVKGKLRVAFSHLREVNFNMHLSGSQILKTN